MCANNSFNTLPEDFPPGHVVSAEGGRGRPVMWVSEEAGPALRRWWERMYDDHLRTGLYPLLLDSSVDIDLLGAAPTTDVIERVPGDQLIREYFDYSGNGWPGFAPAKRLSVHPGYAAGRLAAEAPDTTRLALVPSIRSADTPALIGWTGAMDYTWDVEKISAVLRTWEDRFGIRVVRLGSTTLELSVAAPPSTLTEARRITLEHAGFCPSIWQEEVALDSYATSLVKRPVWRFQWA
ncbi:DUF4253 domain-containing protein [Nocardia macrotermitis]|uniref:DUF4253 domain-containing protein n=1 Tax=Nocardia macrotermitis TaxID=2585198 RepID=A0A7K0D1I1_9NOCA|nr:DUF4253 domain-containing protein [Nocardia macrotermitis]MQY19531.1 hypothetical protein [Nocardia macrotermitis]